MTIGSGDIASALPEREDLLFFASGVSNSQCTDEKEYTREYDLLLEQPRDAHIVYFSSLAVLYSDTRYSQHKRYMEEKIKQLFPRYCIVRLGNITFGKNPNTLINYLRAHPKAPIRDEYRYVISKEEFLHWISLIPPWSIELNCPGKWMTVQEIYNEYARIPAKQV